MAEKDENILLWTLSHNSKNYAAVKKGKHRTFGGELQDQGLYLLNVSLIKEVAASKKGVSTISRFVNINLTIKANQENIDNTTYHEKVSCGERHKIAMRFEVPIGGCVFFLEFNTPAVLRPVYVTAQILRKPQIFSPRGPVVERVTTELLEITSETEAKLANWVEEQAKNREAIKELKQLIESKTTQFEELKKQEKRKTLADKITKKTPNQNETILNNSLLEQETLLRALQKNLRELEIEEIQLGCKQLQLKIQIQKNEINDLHFRIESVDLGDGERGRLVNEKEEKEMLLDSLEQNLLMLQETEGLSSSTDISEEMKAQLFDINSLSSTLREKVQSQIDEWPSLEEFPDILTYPQYKAVDELTRESKYKQKAW
eukprot:CAMPEP_0117017232 /NCGR_PEP_ID=MMETSP0472-20121206/13486_1 /TAXON_ID=693140 ORGANISM="Tiarina fusus, Strain LIS" /NCGR_SAMPLE_ID=MMETSP0472 /ASSEMBLY_ACC=CAM_ASM_000603 /LENGTH=373 /DNA_ID=CAMNT_0004721543 /DNA_START=64 /DNA_END=1182 /DNA_ORIENTATION=+